MPSHVGQYPDPELVVAGWIRSIPGFVIDAVDHRLPWDINVGAGGNGYVQVNPIGGVADVAVPLFHSVCQIDCWVLTPNNDRIFRMQASGIGKEIQYAAWDRTNAERGVECYETLPNGEVITYPNAHVYTAVVQTEPHPFQDRQNPIYRGYTFDLMVTWAAGINTN